MGRRDYGPLPPGPRAPAAVNMARLVQRPMESLLGWRDRYGDVFTVPLLVFGTGVYVSDLDGIRSMLTGDQSRPPRRRGQLAARPGPRPAVGADPRRA